MVKIDTSNVPFYRKLYNNIKKLIITLWEYLIKPIKHIYVLINTPQSGELGRTVQKKRKKTKEL